MAQGQGGEKTESATAKKRRDERKKGNILQSKEITTAAVMLIVFYSLQILMPYMTEGINTAIKTFYEMIPETRNITDREAMNIMIKLFGAVLLVGAPILAISFLAPIFVTMFQTKMLFSAELIKVKFSKLNPLEGIKRMFSLKGLVELTKSIIKVVVICVVIYIYINDGMAEFCGLMNLGLYNGSVYILQNFMSMFGSIAIAFVAVSVLDFLYQRWQFENDMKMSKQEVKEEYKQIEGDPKIKSKIKERQREMSRARMMQEVPTADVVIKNPTHFAVALKYDPDSGNAPMVVAKGADRLAFKILDLAEDHDVPVIENKSVARGLYEAVELGRTIPPDFYVAVAEILALVYNMKYRDEEIQAKIKKMK